ncbi:MAG: hypothetical protein ACI9UR_001502 [Bacteroidia bacterium]|jgi:hypothetical protein
MAFPISIFNRKSTTMKKSLFKTLLVFVSVSSWAVLSSWTGGPAQDCKNDSLAIVRVIKPINELFDIKPVVVVSKGSCRIQEVRVSDAEAGDGDLLAKQTLTNFLSNGYTIQSATESFDSGMRLSTYYLKKKMI